MQPKKNYFEIKHNGYALLILVICLFLFVMILELIDFIAHSFTANWFLYIGLLGFCALLSFPVLFCTLKIKVQDDQITVIKTCGIRFKMPVSKIRKVVIVKPDIVERETNIVTRIKVYAGVKKCYVDSKMKNYDKFMDFITKHVASDNIEQKTNWLTKSRA